MVNYLHVIHVHVKDDPVQCHQYAFSFDILVTLIVQFISVVNSPPSINFGRKLL